MTCTWQQPIESIAVDARCIESLSTETSFDCELCECCELCGCSCGDEVSS